MSRSVKSKRSAAAAVRTAIAAARQRGLGYMAHVVRRVALPRVAYRFGWGPSAPPLAQGVFAAASELAADRVDPDLLRTLGLSAPGISAAARDPVPDEVEQLMDRAHAAGITGVSRSFGRMVRAADGSLRFGDLTGARRHRPGTVPFAAARDADRRDFNAHFGASILTEAGARELIQQLQEQVPSRYRGFTPADLAGLVEGSFAGASVPSDEAYKQILAPIVSGRRVLDLGSESGSMLLAMLRAGATAVTAVDTGEDIAGAIHTAVRIASWRDMRQYRLTVVPGDMRLLATDDVGSFDVVTALGAPRYLREEEMVRIVRRAMAMDAILVFQANADLAGDPAKVLDLHRLIRDGGYAEIVVHTPAGPARPLLVAYTHLAAARRALAAVQTSTVAGS